VSKVSTAARPLVIGRPFRSDRLSHTLLPKRIALPVFASDALSSVAYAPEEVFLILSVAGVAAYALTPWIALAVAAVMLVVVASYRQNVHAYPSGGGDCEVVTTNLGDTALILVLAANTAFNGFPVLGSVLAQHNYLPRQLHTRGDRLAFSNGILFLSGAALLAIIAFRAEVTALIQLYIVGVFISFTLSQIGMVRHWTRLLRTETDPWMRRKMMRSRAVNTVGLLSTGTVLLVVLVTKFVAGAWIALFAMSLLFLMMKMIHRHYNTVSREVEEREAAQHDVVLPSRNHALVLVSKLHLPTLRAVAYARATRPDALEALTVSVDDAETRDLVHKWEESDISVPLKVIASPYREITRRILDYVKRVSKDSPRTVVTVFIPEYVVGHWWEQVLHNQSALRLKGRLLFMPKVMVTSVPWQLNSSERLQVSHPHAAPGDARRGIFD
jgi:hypothetical protein